MQESPQALPPSQTRQQLVPQAQPWVWWHCLPWAMQPSPHAWLLEQTLQQPASAPPRSSAAVPIMNRKERILFDGVDWGARSGRKGGVSVGMGAGG